MGNPPEKTHPTDPMKHLFTFRLTTCAVAASALALGAFGTASFNNGRSSVGQLTADALRESTKLDAQSDFLEAFAFALNGPIDEFREALGEAWDERTETNELADDQHEMRLQLNKKLGHGRYLPDLDPQDFDYELTNPMFFWPVGRTMIYEKVSSEGTERVEITALADTIDINGFECRQVQDLAFLDGQLLEETIDWYAQHSNGDVWYMGEIAKNFDEDGFLEDVDGSWRYGKDGAQPGILMLGVPTVGAIYRQEYFIDEAEDVARVLATNETVVVAAGTFTGCLMTEDGSPIEPGHTEYKYYAPGVGLVLEVDVATGGRLELVEIIN
jgi:hypothetical protein